MKKNLFTTVLFLVTFYLFGQNEISLEITNATYKAKETKLVLNISITNNTDSLVYIISPKNYFFNKHFDQKNKLGSNGLDKAPFVLDITSNKKCKIENEDYSKVDLETIAFHILSSIIEIKPNESKLFENIEIERYDGEFCSKRKYEIKVVYKPQINLTGSEFINDLYTKSELISKETKKLNKLLYYNLGSYRSIEKDNFKKLNEFLIKVPKIESLNNKVFESNTIKAIEIK